MNQTIKPGSIVFVAAFSAFLATFNETFLNVAFSPIMADLQVSVSTVQWLAAAYMLGAAVMVPVSAFLYRRIPTRPLYLTTVGFLIVGSVVGALAPSFPILLAGRVIQAIGTGMLIPVGMNITLEVAPKQKLGTYMGIMGAMTTLGPSTSVIAAGVLLTFFPWRALLWVFAGLSALCFLCGLALLKNVAKLTNPKLDVLSPILIGIALIGILYGISTIFSGNAALAVIAAAVGIVFLILFVLRQKKLAEPLIDLRPLSVKPFAIGVLINMLSLIVIFAMNIVMPLFMQSALGESAFKASLTLFPAILLSCVISPLAGRVYDKHGAKVLLPLGFLMICLFTFALGFAHSAGSLLLLSILYIPVICGSALIIGPIQSFSLSFLTPELNPHGVTVMSTGFQIAGCIGSSLFSGVYAMNAQASQGFTASSMLAAALSLIGLILAFAVSRMAPAIQKEQKKSAIGRIETSDISGVMKQNVYSVSVHDTLFDALKCMAENKTGGIPVLADDGHAAGFISDGDIVRFMLDSDTENNAGFASIYPLWHNPKALDEQMEQLNQYNVMELANRKVISVDIHDDMRALFKILSDKRIKKVPVLDNSKVVGTASRSDLLRLMIATSSLAKES